VDLSIPVRRGQNVLAKGREMRAGEVAVPRGTLLHPTWLGVLASVGRADVCVIPPPQVAIVPTGDELAEPGQPLQPGQIRNSNAIMLEVMARSSGAHAQSLPIAPDDPPRLRAILEQGMDADVLIVTGGVSAGARDHVPAALLDLGAQPLFHKVRLKPGKPLWFGIGPERRDRSRALIFGLPGNPVGGLVGFLLFIAPALAALAGRTADSTRRTQARLSRPFTHRGERPTFYPARLVPTPNAQAKDGTLSIETLDWAGSADLRTVASADGFAVFPAGDRDYEPGEIVAYHPLR
jgi:molybdopterin molybdotransferase